MTGGAPVECCSALCGPYALQRWQRPFPSVCLSDLLAPPLLCRFIEPTPDTEELNLQQLAEAVGPRTRLVSLVHVSNMLGCITDAQRVVEIAKGVGARVRGGGSRRGGAVCEPENPKPK